MDNGIDAAGVLRANREFYEAGESYGMSRALRPAAEALVAAWSTRW